MRLSFDTQAEAQKKADEIHAWMLANSTEYAASVAAGQTKAWAVPYQDRDENDIPVGKWHVSVKPRCAGSLTKEEISRAR